MPEESRGLSGVCVDESLTAASGLVQAQIAQGSLPSSSASAHSSLIDASMGLDNVVHVTVG
jgi:hypothetical protein